MTENAPYCGWYLWTLQRNVGCYHSRFLNCRILEMIVQGGVVSQVGGDLRAFAFVFHGVWGAGRTTPVLRAGRPLSERERATISRHATVRYECDRVGGDISDHMLRFTSAISAGAIGSSKTFRFLGP